MFSGTGQKYTISKQNKFSLKPRGINIPAETLSLNDCVIISSTFPAINNQQTCFVIKAVFRKNMSAGIGCEINLKIQHYCCRSEETQRPISLFSRDPIPTISPALILNVA